jgi:hypothetical protein
MGALPGADIDDDAGNKTDDRVDATATKEIAELRDNLRTL